MAEKATRRDVTEIDPMFHVPDGVDELVYSEFYESGQDPAELEEDFIEDNDEDYNDYSDAPDTPIILGVVSQTLRTTKAGTQRVDLVIEVEEVDGLDKYDIRVAKV